MHSQADDTFGLLSTNEVLTLHLVASVKASKPAKVDHKLMLMELLQACTSYLKYIKEAGWPEKHISALFKFFWNMECHPLRLSTRHRDHILATYTAKTWRHWHNKLKSGNTFNITIINENLLQHVVIEVNDAMLGKVSVSLKCYLCHHPSPLHSTTSLPWFLLNFLYATL